MQQMITILGPTASGKTPLAAALAAALPQVDGHIGAEIISADSRQVYRRMDIGTGKDLADYTVQGSTFLATPHSQRENVQRSTFNVQRSTFNVQRSTLKKGIYITNGRKVIKK